MSGYNVSVAHDLGREAALDRVRTFLDQVRHNYGDDVSDVQGDWNDNRLDFGFAARGFAVRGLLLVEVNAVHVSGPLPLAAMFFRGRIEQQIRQELVKLLQ